MSNINLKSFKKEIKRKINSPNLFFSNTSDTFFADYFPKYPDKSAADLRISYCWTKGAGEIRGNLEAFVPTIIKYDSFDSLLEYLKGMEQPNEKLPIKFVWAIEVYTIKNSNNLFIAQCSESKEDEDYYHCEIISINKIKENIDDYKNGIINFGELISNSIVDECCIGVYDNVEKILNIELDKYISGWDNSYYEDAIINGIEQISDINFG